MSCEILIFVSKLAYKIGLKTAEDCYSSTTLLSSAQLGKSKALGCWNEMLIEWNIVISLVKHRILGAETAQDFG